MRIIIPLALLCASASAQTVNPVLATIASQESAEAWQGANAMDYGLPPGSALFICGAISDASPEIQLTPAEIVILTRSIVRLERADRYGSETAQRRASLPANAAGLIAHSLAIDSATAP